VDTQGQVRIICKKLRWQRIHFLPVKDNTVATIEIRSQIFWVGRMSPADYFRLVHDLEGKRNESEMLFPANDQVAHIRDFPINRIG
jgi:hypothetical protein